MPRVQVMIMMMTVMMMILIPRVQTLVLGLVMNIVMEMVMNFALASAMIMNPGQEGMIRKQDIDKIIESHGLELTRTRPNRDLNNEIINEITAVQAGISTGTQYQFNVLSTSGWYLFPL